jgi:Zn ribbon nucleic-acid-binding protein
MTKSPIWTVCPACHQRSGLPLGMGAGQGAQYFECDACGHVWKVDAPPPDRPGRPKKPTR